VALGFPFVVRFDLWMVGGLALSKFVFEEGAREACKPRRENRRKENFCFVRVNE
jgi:hypothetical protein